MGVGPTPGPIIRVFGGIGVDGPDGPVGIGGHRQRRLLALLVVRSESVVSIDWLAEYLWSDEDRPDASVLRIRTYVSRLRQALPERAQQWIETESSGYRFAAPAGAVEHRQFASLRASARLAREHGDPLRALTLLDEALGLWRGAPFGELEDLVWARADIARLQLDRLEMLEERWESALALGRHTQITGELAAFTAEHGDRDRAVRQHALALHRSGRTPEALRVIADHRRLLADDTGLDPSPAIGQLEQALLAGDASLDAEPVGRPLRGYRLLEEAGTGAFSVVWRGLQPSVDREVAIKQIRAELASQPDFIRRFEAEAHLVARIEHPHIVPLIDYWRDPDSAYLVMRWLGGGTLERRLDEGPLTVAETLTLARQIGDALSAAHSHGVVHRDVKTANILFDEAGNGFLGDFGIALEAAESTGPEAALSPGSPLYASPEQIRHERLGPEADVFSLGVVLFECLTGSVPFPDNSSVEEMIGRQLNAPYPSLSELRADVPNTVSNAVARATAKEPANRFSTITDFLDALEDGSSAARRESAGVVPVGEVENPYIGLRAFDAGDTGRFFGRERLIDELVARFAGNSVRSRCVVVVGPSGSGKSSIVRAGLLPTLRSGAVPGSAEWFTTTMVPGTDPFESLEAALLRIAVNPPPALLSQLRDRSRGILRGVRRCVPDDSHRVVLVIDQFEEMFTAASADDADQFLTALSVAIEDPTTPLRLVVTLRADYYGRPLEHLAFAPIVKEAAVDVTPLAADELERAITAPAGRLGIGFETGLVSRIVAETVGQPSPLPMLQYTLGELFDRRRPDGNTLSSSTYDDIGGITGALAARAEGLYAEADDSQRAAIRRVFGRMTNPGDETADIRRRAAIADFGDHPAAWVVDRFAAARLLTVDRDVITREPTVEVAHEALLRKWPRLAGWLNDDRELLRSVDSIAAAAASWHEGGRQASDLHRGGRLENAIELGRTEPGRLRSVDSEFINASRVHAEDQSHTEQRRLRRLRRLVVGTALALLGALVAGGFAVIQQRRAENEANAAEAAATEAELATLISRSAAQTTEAPDLALLLALESHRRAPGAETEQAVLNALGNKSIARRVASFDPLDTDDSCTSTIVESSGLREFGLVDGQLARRDLTTGGVVKLGSPPQECVQWMADEALDVRWARTLDGQKMWWGSFGGPWEVVREFDRNTVLWKSQFSASGRMFFFSDSGASETLLVLDDTTGETVQIVDGGGSLLGFDVSPDGSLFAVGYGIRGGADDGLTMVFDSETGGEIFRVTSSLPASRVIFDEASGELIAGIVDGTILTINLETEEVVSTVRTSATSDFVDMELVRPDGLLTVVTPGQVELVDRRAGPVGEPVELRNVFNARIRPDGTVLALASAGLSVLDLDSSALVEDSHAVEPFANLAIAGGRAAAVLPPEGDPVVVDLAAGSRTTARLTTLDGERFGAVFAAPELDGIVAIDNNHVIARWEDGQMVERIDLGGTTLRGTIDGRRFAVLGEQPEGTRIVNLVSLDPSGMAVLFTVPAQNAITTRPLPDGGLLILDRDGTLRTYDSAGAQINQVDTGAPDAIVTALDATTGLLAIAAESGGVLLLDMATGAVESLPGPDLVAGLGFVRGGELLAVTSLDGTVRLWDVARGTSVGVIWDGSGAILRSPVWYDEVTDSIWMSTSGRIVRVSLDPQRWVERACEIVGRDLTQEEWDRFVPGDGQPQPVCL